MSQASGLQVYVLEEALPAQVVRVDVGGTWEGGDELGQIDGFDPESSSGQASVDVGCGRKRLQMEPERRPHNRKRVRHLRQRLYD